MRRQGGYESHLEKRRMQKLWFLLLLMTSVAERRSHTPTIEIQKAGESSRRPWPVGRPRY